MCVYSVCLSVCVCVGGEGGGVRIPAVFSQDLFLYTKPNYICLIIYTKYTTIYGVCVHMSVCLCVCVFVCPLLHCPAVPLFTAAMDNTNDPNPDWQPLVNALKLLPKAHYNVLKYLAEHLHRYVCP